MVKVLYIAGFGRNGSTILGNILGSLPRFVHVGELIYIWDRGILENWDCGCGEPFSRCAFWEKVVRSCEITSDLAQKMLHLRERGLRSRHLFCSERRKQKLIAEMDEYLECLKNLYHHIVKETKCEWMVDSSKFPSHAYLLNHIEKFDVRILHLVRDPRDVAYSWWRRPKKLTLSGDRRMPRFLPVKSATFWFEWNYLIQRTWKNSPNYLLIRYEDFLRNPKNTLNEIIDWLKVDSIFLKEIFLKERIVKIKRQHTVSGNPDRFKTEAIEIHGLQSQEKIGIIWSAIISMITIPLLKKYGYPLWR